MNLSILQCSTIQIQECGVIPSRDFRRLFRLDASHPIGLGWVRDCGAPPTPPTQRHRRKHPAIRD